VPIYEYECVKCGHALEAIQKFSDPVLTECPACHETSLRKRVSAPAFHLKGSGWYVTDFKDKPKDKSNTADDAKQSGNTSAKEPDKPGTKTTSTDSAPVAKKTETTASD
jgi:putative FmdB family regulatory protein